mgnify:CR=1 FL=1
MKKDLFGVMAEVQRYLAVASDLTQVDPARLDMNRVKVPQGIFDKVNSLQI